MSFMMLITSINISQPENFYNVLTGEISCTDFESCLHEAGHKSDAQNGWISESQEWKNAVDIYRLVTWSNVNDRVDMSIKIEYFPGVGAPRSKETNPLVDSFYQGGWGGYTELYADIVMYSGGDFSKIPTSLQKFYKFDEINKIMKTLGY